MDLMNFMEVMGTNNIPLVAAFFIGLMNAVSPCTLATNVTAIAYITRKIGDNKSALLVGLLYTLGRMLTYTLIAALIVYAGLSDQSIALPLELYGPYLIGPVLIFSGLVLLEIIKLDFIKLPGLSNKIEDKISDQGYIGGFLLGAFFALAFCPFSAVLYFGMLIPLALQTRDGIIVPAVFAFATGLPVIISSFILVFCMHKIGEIMHKVQQIESYARKISAITFIIAGTYYLLQALSIIT